MINNRGGAKNAYVAIRSQHKFMLRLHVAITCCDLMLQSDVHFSVGFPVFAVEYFSKLEFCIYDCLFLVGFPVAGMVADMKVDMVPDMKVDMVADMKVDYLLGISL